MKGAKGVAAVLIVEAEGASGRQLLLTQRAMHLNSHGGEVAFPGGMWEPEDETLLDTALRETQEEVGIAPSQVEVLGELPIGYTRAGVKVKPYVGRVKAEVALVMDPSELSAIFWLPETFLGNCERIRTDVFSFGGVEVWAPAYRYQGFEVWGYTSRVMVQFMSAYWGVTVPRASAAPVVTHKVL